jgi:hypothetical protein
MYKRKRKWNRELDHTDWKTTVKYMDYKNGVIFRCVNKDCGLKINRQTNAAINIYLKMEGLSRDIGWFDENVVRGFTQTGAEWKETDELVRSLYDTMKPQFYGVL